MAVTKSQTRKYVAIDWDPDALEAEEVTITATNPNATSDDEDVSTKTDENSGESFVTYPYDYHGVSDIVISDDEGNSEEGQIEV